MRRFQASNEEVAFHSLKMRQTMDMLGIFLRGGEFAAGRAGDMVSERASDRKAWQLCRQVAEALDEALADCGDDVLQNLHVLSVTPCPDASRLLVTVMSIDDRPGKTFESRTVLDHLENAGWPSQVRSGGGRDP